MKWAIIRKKEKYILVLLFAVYAVINNCFLHIGCVWRYLFGIPCIGCGMTHALTYMIKGDLRSAFHWHPMFWSVFILVPYFLREGHVFRNKTVNAVVGYGILAGFVLAWVYRMYRLIRFGEFW